MSQNSNQYFANSSKRLPIVFCLDVSPSMGWKIGGNSSAISLLNAAVENFLGDLKADPNARASAEVAFVTFSSKIKTDTPFEPISSVKTPRFRPVWRGGTNLAEAVLRAIEKIEDRRKELESADIPYYAPFLVIVTDGDPDDTADQLMQMQAVSAVKRYCDSSIGATEIIVPFVIGVGDHISPETLNEYAAGFTKGYFPIKGTAESVKAKFNKAFNLIGNSTKKSIHLNGKAEDIITIIKVDMHDLYNDLVGK